MLYKVDKWIVFPRYIYSCILSWYFRNLCNKSYHKRWCGYHFFVELPSVMRLATCSIFESLFTSLCIYEKLFSFAILSFINSLDASDNSVVGVMDGL